MKQLEDNPDHFVKQVRISRARRKLLKRAAIGSTIASVWQQPIIEAVVMPAHAQTSVITDDQPSSTPRNFFATATNATEITASGNLLLNILVPVAHARVAPTNELPLSSLRFEAEAIDQGNNTYKVKVAAEDDPNLRVKANNPLPKEFVFGWEATISNINTASTFTPTGCAQAEMVKITSLTTTSLTLEMSYFSKTIELLLDAGSASLPSFPLSCAAVG